MINKKLLFSVKESIPYIQKNVLYQWIRLICNVCSTACLCLIIAKHRNILCIGILFICLILRYIVNQKAIEMSYLSSHIVKETLRSRLYKKLSKIGIEYTNKWSTAEIVQLSSEGIEQLETYFANYIPQFFYPLIAPITLFIIISFMNFKAALVLLVCVPLIPMRQLGSYFHIAMNGMAASDKLFAILEKEIEEKQNVKLDSYSISAHNLHFGYTDKEVLQGIHFKAFKEMIGFVGESGKSTIVSLLMGQYSNYRGELKLSNYEIKDINIYPYMALVSLESYLFSGTLKDNLSVAKDASEKEMNSVLEKVGILDFVHEQGGLNMHIEKRPFMETKTFCSQCKVHCYKKDKREQIRKVMRFSGPRMLVYHPIMAIRHLYYQITDK